MLLMHNLYFSKNQDFHNLVQHFNTGLATFHEKKNDFLKVLPASDSKLAFFSLKIMIFII